MMGNISPAKVGFVVSVAVLAFLYGFMTRANHWAPTALLQQVQQEASSLWYEPSLTTRIYDRQGIRTERPDDIQPGLTLINSFWEDSDEWSPAFKLVDRQGETIHSWWIDREALFPEAIDRRGDPDQKNVHGSHLLPNGDLLVNVGYVGTVRLDACGEVQWRLPAGTHHSIERAADGSFWIPGVSKRPRLTTARHPNGLPGLEEPIWIDQIHRVSAEGTILDTTDVPDLLYANNLERYLAKYGSEHKTDITHLNDVEPLPPSMAETYPLLETGDLLVSIRNLHLVFVYDPDTGRIKWHMSEPFNEQHDPDFIGNGWIGVFDNNQDFMGRGTLSGGSRIVTVQPHTDSTVVQFPTAHSDPFYTGTMGKWQQLDNGNMLLAETKAGRAVEVNPEGRTVWELVRKPHSSSKVPRVPKAARFDLTPEEVASWPCSSENSHHASKSSE